MNSRCLCPLCCTSKNRESLPAVCRCSLPPCRHRTVPPPTVTAVSSPSHPTYLQECIRQAYGTKLFKVEILLNRIAYRTKRITFLFCFILLKQRGRGYPSYSVLLFKQFCYCTYRPASFFLPLNM